MNSIAIISLNKFMLIYIALIFILFIMRKFKINQEKLLFLASARMSIQLIIAGYILTYIFKHPSPIFVAIYLLIMVSFAIYRVIGKNADLNLKFKLIIGASLFFSGFLTILFFIYIIIGKSIFNPQYAIPISGMLFGNSMNGTAIAIKTFNNLISAKKLQIKTLVNIGIDPEKILLPFVRESLETALIPTLNSMVGMGIVSLPGMMTGQILSGTLPTTAILYQICITIAITLTVCLSSFFSLYFGQKTLLDSNKQIKI